MTEKIFRTSKIKNLPITIVDGDRSSRYPKRDELQKEGIPFLNSTNINDFCLDLTDVNFVSEEKFKTIKKGILKKQDIVMTTRGSVGKVALFNSHYESGIINAQMFIIRADGQEINQNYLFYVLCSQDFQLQIRNYSSGSAQPQLPIRDFNEMELQYPPLPTQHKIASVLSAYDDLIENNTRRIKILEEMASSIYREWFVNFRFPGHEKVKMVESQLGLIPEGWEVCTLGDVAGINLDTIKKNQLPDYISYVDISSVESGRIRKKEQLEFLKAPGRARRKIKHGDIIWSCVRPNLRAYALTLHPENNLVASTGFAVITSRCIPYTYLYGTVTTDEFVSHLSQLATGAAYPAVTVKDFSKSIIIKPSGCLSEDFHKISEPIYELISWIVKSSDFLSQTRDLLLPRLVSGEIDVTDLDIEIPGD